MSANRPIQRASLADQFKGSGSTRATGLSGLLPPTKSQPSTPPASATTSAPEPPATSAAERPTTPRRTKTPEASNATKNITVYFDVDVFETVYAARREGVAPTDRDRTYDEILVDALSRVSIADLQNHFTSDDAPAVGLLQPRNRRVSNPESVQRQIRLNESQREAIDNLASQVGAPSRNAFINAAYRLAFLTR